MMFHDRPSGVQFLIMISWTMSQLVCGAVTRRRRWVVPGGSFPEAVPSVKSAIFVQLVPRKERARSQNALTRPMRERLSLVVLLTICRRFHACLPPAGATELGELLCAPTQILNECLGRLVRMKLIATVRPADSASATEFRYTPARPLERITLFDFKTLDDNLGEDPIGSNLENIDPLLPQYDAALQSLGDHPFFRKNLAELFADYLQQRADSGRRRRFG